MRLRVLSLLTLFVILLPTAGKGQEIEQFRLDSFITDVVERNPSIQGAEQEWIASQQRPSVVGSYDDPMITFTRWLSTPETRVGPQVNAFMLNQRIPFPGKLGKMENMAEEDANAAGERYSISRRDLIVMAKLAYYDLYRVDASLEILDEYLHLLNDFLAVAETQYTTGDGIQANVFKTQVEVSTILDKQVQFRAMRQGVIARINALRNRSQTTPVGRITAVDVNTLVVQDSVLVESALSARQELGIASAMIRKSESAQEFAELDYYPNFTLSAAYVTIPSGFSPAPDAGKDPYSIGIGINIPIMFGRRNAAVEEAKATNAANTFRLANLQNNITSEVLDINSQVRESRQSLEIYRQGLLVQAQSSLESAMGAYQTGKIEYLSLLDAYRMILQVRLGYVNEQSRYGKVVAALERAGGGRLPE